MREHEGTRERFVREAQVLARLQHNSIVQIVEFGALENGWPFLAMEYIEGSNLERLVEARPLPLSPTLVVLEQLASALAYAHDRGVVHRDLKPSNVLVRGGDVRQVKIIDFGLALVLDSDAPRLTDEKQMIGSVAYMAPEQVERERNVTGAADIYALAGLAYRLLSGAPPFTYSSPVRLMTARSAAPTRRRCSTRCSSAACAAIPRSVRAARRSLRSSSVCRVEPPSSRHSPLSSHHHPAHDASKSWSSIVPVYPKATASCSRRRSWR
jgi:serine/threonine protein kinase